MKRLLDVKTFSEREALGTTWLERLRFNRSRTAIDWRAEKALKKVRKTRVCKKKTKLQKLLDMMSPEQRKASGL